MTTLYTGLAGGKILSGKSSQFIPFWQPAFLTKPAVGLPEFKDHCEPFVHLWRGGARGSWGLQSAPV